MPGDQKIKIIIVQGPTASGKSELAVRLAERFAGEIVNADSMQVYRFMDIGTAKPSPDQLRRVPHHLLDIVTPDQTFSAADFCQEAEKVILDIARRGKRAIVCGGTGLYIRALTKGLMDSPPVDDALRNELKVLAGREGSRELHRRLAEIDPLAAERIHPNDQFRIIRALEVFQLTGRPISELREKHRFGTQRYDYCKIGLTMNRASLYRNIGNRVDMMIRQGFLEEVEALLAAGYPSGLKSMRSLGYRHLCNYLDGLSTLDDALQLIKRDTRRYAKRQLTWFNQDQEINWIEYPENVAMIEHIAHDYFD
ncbi:MAG: tRNA (adenosine(37)-N6)-dimethylallyltransferase MiaA [Deltaproteobacteria bacterium]|nr:tRNA (adenosine(37)-N6)-dimethylallyltransferase MiaA [Deltaproteobacteria bacterium]TLN01860.1 MAG: tRNA (adenosine(37)-N6)-dimethylallyltransferase MiaA [bacterium]